LTILSAKPAATSTTASIARSAHQVHAAADIARKQDDETTYNPRALLDPIYAPKPDYVPPSSVVHAGRSFYIRSTERPVTEVAVTDETGRRTYPGH
jgi:hypothetical protein